MTPILLSTQRSLYICVFIRKISLRLCHQYTTWVPLLSVKSPAGVTWASFSLKTYPGAQKAISKLSVIRRTFSHDAPPIVKRQLYLSLVRSQLSYGSQLWRPMFQKDIVLIESVQRRATRYILNDWSSSYRERLIHLNLLPLMYYLELLDIFFFISCLFHPDPSFNINDYVTFSNCSTRSTSSLKLLFKQSSTNSARHFYFYRITRLWNSLPPIDLSLSLATIKVKLKNLFWSHFLSHFDSHSPCTFHFICPCSKCHSLNPAPSTLTS